MQVRQQDSTAERRVLIAAVTETSFLSRLVGKLSREPFRSKYSNLLWTWCQSHYIKYQCAPGKDIETVFEEWAAKNSDKDLYTLVSRFLSSLSSQSDKEQLNLDYLLTLAEKLVNEVVLEKHQEELKDFLEHGEVDRALEMQQKFKKIDLLYRPPINVITDEDAQRKALEDTQKCLIRYPGPAGDFLGTELAEDSFVAFMASAKGGKSWSLLDVAWRGFRQGNNVAYFQIGDLSQSQIMRRFLIRAAYRPIRAKLIKLPQSIVIPPGSRELANVECEAKIYDTDITWEQARRAFIRAGKKAKGQLRLSHHPSFTITVDGIRNVLDTWDRDGWVANVVVIDYAGNIAPVNKKIPSHEQVSYSWAMLRQLSEIRKCLVVTAQQSNKEGFGAWVLTRKNFSESKLILAHCTSFIGINRTDEEVEHNIIRWNFLVRREEKFRESQCLFLAACLDVANPAVVTSLPG
jgi:hypothetical protein